VTKTKPKTLQVLIVIFTSLFFAAISFGLIRDSSHKPEGSAGEVAFAFFTTFFAICYPYIFFQRAPTVVFTTECITVKSLFKTKKYLWPTVADIFFSTKEYYSIFKLFGRGMESSCIHFDNGEKVILWEEIYSNLPQVRQLIYEKEKVKIRDEQSKATKSQLIPLGNKVYAGNPLISSNTVLLLLPLVLVALSFSEPTMPITPLLSFMLVLFFAAFFAVGTQMNYFIVNGENLIIKNHFFLWKEKTFNLNDINGFVFERQYRRSNALRILTKEFESKKFAAGSLRDKHWLSFKEDMTRLGIPVRSQDLY
jgi:hypothetical protein